MFISGCVYWRLIGVSENVTPVSRHRIDTSFFDFEEKEAPYPNGGKLRRAVAFPGQKYFVVADIVTSPVAAEAVALLHGGRAKMEGEGTIAFGITRTTLMAKPLTCTLGRSVQRMIFKLKTRRVSLLI